MQVKGTKCRVSEILTNLLKVRVQSLISVHILNILLVQRNCKNKVENPLELRWLFIVHGLKRCNISVILGELGKSTMELLKGTNLHRD